MFMMLDAFIRNAVGNHLHEEIFLGLLLFSWVVLHVKQLPSLRKVLNLGKVLMINEQV